MLQKIFPVFVIQLLITQAAIPFERIEPKGIIGSLLLSPEHAVDSNQLERMRDPSPIAHLCLVVEKRSPVEYDPVLIDGCSRISADLTIVRIARELTQQQREVIRTASCIWVASDSVRLPNKLGEICKGRLSATKSLILTGNCAALAFGKFQMGQEDPKQIGWKLIPDSNAVFQVDPNKDSGPRLREPGLLFALGRKASMLFQGRRFQASDSSVATLHLLDENHRRRSIEINATRQDLTAVRRSIRKVNFPSFREGFNRSVPVGSLLIVGGGSLPKPVVQRFVENAGGNRARIVIFPTSLPDPIPESLSIEKTLRKENVQKITILPDRELSAVESTEFISAIDNATAIWFNGGRQWRFVDAYQDTAAELAINRLLQRGGVIGGSSAGASIQGDYLARGNPLGNLDIMAAGYEKGLGFLPGVAIDQHFSQRDRLPQLKSLVLRYPQFLGIGIDESTAIYVKDSVAEVLGKGQVFFLDVADGNLRTTPLKEGKRFDLNRLKTMDDEESNP